MTNEEIIIRTAALEDAEEILEIYKPYVLKTAISFEYEIPALEEFKERMKNTMKKYPYLVAESGKEILGYAYTGPFVGRAAYQWSAEVTIYLKENKRKMGIGRRLYEALEGISKVQNIQNLNACIGDPEVEDAYLTKNSVQFHAHLGYNMVGKFHNSGYKFQTWYNMVWMEKILGEHNTNPSPVICFPDLSAETLHTLGIQVLERQAYF